MPQKKGVLQILYSGLGGHGSVAFSLAAADTGREWDQLLLFYGIEPLLPAYEQKCNQLQIPFATVHKQGKNFLKYWLQVLRQIRQWQPEVIILHSLTLILPVAWYCQNNNCRLIVVEHTPNQVKTAKEQKASALAMKYADQVVLLTEAYQTELKDLLGTRFAARKTVVIPNGIDTDYWHPEAKQQSGNAFRIGMAARFSASKDFSGLIQAFALLLKEPGLPVNPVLVLAGDGSTQTAAKELVQNLGIQKEVTFAGNLDEENLRAFFQQTDLYVHASKGETMSTAIMQALSCGLPLIASDIPGINNLIDGTNGWLYEPCNERNLCQKMLALIRQPEVRDELAKNARTFALQNLSAGVMLHRYQQVAQSL